ncbi:MAG: YbaK/EbsC family protein, partial [Candidatus Bathyarchaeia archaeon]
LKEFIQKSNTEAKILVFESPTITVEDAEKQLKVSKERIIKSILFVDENGKPILAIVTGDKNVDEEKLKNACKSKNIKIARPRAVKNLTGYEVGAMPPIGFKKPIRTFIDPKVFLHERVYGGGSSINALLEIKPQDIKKLTNGEVIDISKD